MTLIIDLKLDGDIFLKYWQKITAQNYSERFVFLLHNDKC